MQAMNLKFRFSFIFKGFRTIHIPTEHPYSPSKCRFYSSRLPVYVLFILLCSSNLLRFTCLFHVSWKDYFPFTKSFKDSRLWHYLSFPQSTDYLEPQIVFAGQRSLPPSRWKHDWVMCRDPNTKSGPEVARDYSWENFPASFCSCLEPLNAS